MSEKEEMWLTRCIEFHGMSAADSGLDLKRLCM